MGENFYKFAFTFAVLAFAVASAAFATEVREVVQLRVALTGDVIESIVLPNGEHYKVLTIEGRRFLVAEILETVEGGPTCESRIIYGDGTSHYNPQRFECRQVQNTFFKKADP